MIGEKGDSECVEGTCSERHDDHGENENIVSPRRLRSEQSGRHFCVEDIGSQMKKNGLGERGTRITRDERISGGIRLTKMIEIRIRGIGRLFLVAIDQVGQDEEKIAHGEEKGPQGNETRTIVLRTKVRDQRNGHDTRDIITAEGDTQTGSRETIITFQRGNDRTNVSRRDHRLR